jgi:hypothetical protein
VSPNSVGADIELSINVLQFVKNHCHLDGWLDDVVPPPPVAFWRDARTVTPLDECVISVPALLRGCSDSTAS